MDRITLLNRRDRLWTYGSIAVGCLVWVLAIAALLLLGACAVGRRELDGAVVIGFEAGKLVETGNQALGALFGPAGLVASGGAVGVAGIVGKLWASAAANKAARAAEEKGWQDAAATFSAPPPNPKGTA